MEIRFLGTGSAWRLPEHSCRCAICEKMAQLGEERTRTSIEIRNLFKNTNRPWAGHPGAYEKIWAQSSGSGVDYP